uniref:Uncharacterized protein n=1 Tax=Anguilla anguilla TaxID=7936 RepID=A0A0E9RQC6_ANGAN
MTKMIGRFREPVSHCSGTHVIT